MTERWPEGRVEPRQLLETWEQKMNTVSYMSAEFSQTT